MFPFGFSYILHLSRISIYLNFFVSICMQAFHIFHISCLIQWILLCEVEIFAKQSVEPKGKLKPRRKVKGKKRQKPETQHNQMYSIYCPECQGTGIGIDGNELEKPTVPLSEVHYFLQLCSCLGLSSCCFFKFFGFFLAMFTAQIYM